MIRNMLVIIENETIFPEAIDYARELAKRTDAKVAFLMLVPMSFTGRTFLVSKRNALRKIESRAGKLLSSCLETFIQQGIEVSSALKIGDPGQELMKFLANNAPFQTIVWGSGNDLPDKYKSSQRHWISRIVSNLECPLLTVSKRE